MKLTKEVFSQELNNHQPKFPSPSNLDIKFGIALYKLSQTKINLNPNSNLNFQLIQKKEAQNKQLNWE